MTLELFQYTLLLGAYFGAFSIYFIIGRLPKYLMTSHINPKKDKKGEPFLSLFFSEVIQSNLDRIIFFFALARSKCQT
ncbi:hypothetical protein SUT007_17260 [Streptococcus parasuis]|nr:hypothetical protein SUT007_17260 [Streptococcus parasuis]